MKRLCLAVTLIASATTTASANTYLGLGIGTSPAVDDEPARLDGDGRSGKVLAGMRFGNISVEGAISRFGVTFTQVNGSVSPYGDTYQASGALRLSVPLGNNFEAFARAGLHHTWISADRNPDVNDVSGDGYLVGAGVEYRLNLVATQASLFLDYQFNDMELAGDRRQFDGNFRMWTIGLTVGL